MIFLRDIITGRLNVMRINLDLDKLKTFYYVAKAKKFTTASEILNISQPALSRSIQLLEDRLGIKLFYRHARGLTLTAQGSLWEASHNPPYGKKVIMGSEG